MFSTLSKKKGTRQSVQDQNQEAKHDFILCKYKDEAVNSEVIRLWTLQRPFILLVWLTDRLLFAFLWIFYVLIVKWICYISILSCKTLTHHAQGRWCLFWLSLYLYVKSKPTKTHVSLWWCLPADIRSEELHSQCRCKQAAGCEQDNCGGVVDFSPSPLVLRPFTKATFPFFAKVGVKFLLLFWLEVDRAAELR